MPAVAPHDTQVVDQPWSGDDQVTKLSTPVTKALGTGMFAWYDSSAGVDDNGGYPDAKSGYKFPHHMVGADGHPGAANVRAARNGLARLDQADISDGDQAGVRKHLQTHIDDFNSKNGTAGDEPATAQAGRRGGSLLLAATLVGKHLALRPETVMVLRSAIAANAQPPFVQPDDGDDEDEMDDQPCPGVIPLYGMITPFGGGGLFALLFGGGGGLDQFRRRLDAAVNDPAVSHIVLDVDSPGGLVDLVPETAAEVRAARAVKPVTAVANTEAASAAYWIASQANDLVITPSGQVGSIGVYQMHQDVSQALDMDGIKISLISAGKYKVEGNPYEPLGGEARTAMQDQIDTIYGQFVNDVAAGRGVDVSRVANGFGQGRTLLAGDAVTEGMADRAATFQQVMAELTTAAVGGDDNPTLTPAASAQARADAVDLRTAA